MLVPYAAARMFELVDRVEDYPRFLPWCAGAATLETHPGGKTARIDIDYHGVRAHFTTDNVNTPNSLIVIRLKHGPFRKLHGEWRFLALDQAACKIEFELTYEFASLAPPTEEQQALFARLREDPEQTNRFFGTVAGTVPIPEFFGAPAPA